jgi:hypothetical protein
LSYPTLASFYVHWVVAALSVVAAVLGVVVGAVGGAAVAVGLDVAGLERIILGSRQPTCHADSLLEKCLRSGFAVGACAAVACLGCVSVACDGHR